MSLPASCTDSDIDALTLSISQTNSFFSSQETHLPDDLHTLFQSILTEFSDQEYKSPLIFQRKVNTLLAEENTRLVLSKTTFKGISLAWSSFVQNSNVQTDLMLKLVNSLYSSSLIMGETRSRYIDIQAKLPELTEILQTNIPQTILEIVDAISTEKKSYSRNKTPEGLRNLISKVDEAVRKLSSFRTLKQFIDPNENERMLDLASVLGEKYASFILEYSNIISKITAIVPSLDSAAAAITSLAQWKMRHVHN
jgi:hypothetical protein